MLYVKGEFINYSRYDGVIKFNEGSIFKIRFYRHAYNSKIDHNDIDFKAEACRDSVWETICDYFRRR